MFSLPARRYFARTGPRAGQIKAPGSSTAGMPGSIVVLPVTTSASYVNLQTLLAQTPTQVNSSAFTDQVNGVQDVRIVLQAIGATVGLILGNVVGDVTGANAPVLATQGVLSAGAYTPTAGTCWQLVPGTTLELEAVLNQDVFLGFVGSASGSLSLFQCSRSSPQ